jgi:hypothetical protein
VVIVRLELRQQFPRMRDRRKDQFAIVGPVVVYLFSGDACHSHTIVDAWANSQTDSPARSEAIRRLVEFGLKGKK